MSTKQTHKARWIKQWPWPMLCSPSHTSRPCGQQGHDTCSFPSRRKLWGVCELNTERPPDNLEEPLPIYTASRWCLSVAWQEGVLSNCLKPHIVVVDKESLLGWRYKVQVKLSKTEVSGPQNQQWAVIINQCPQWKKKIALGRCWKSPNWTTKSIHSHQ